MGAGKELLNAENAKNTKAVFLTGLTGWTGFLTGKIRNEFARMGRQRPGSIPKGIASSSPGLRGTPAAPKLPAKAGATLGNASTPNISTPTGLRHLPVAPRPRAMSMNGEAATPLGLNLKTRRL